MIKELAVISSGRGGTEFEGGVSIPYSEMRGFYKKGEKLLVYIADDSRDKNTDFKDGASDADAAKVHRVASLDITAPVTSAKIYNQLRRTDKYRVGDTVAGIVYELKPEMGAFVAVDDAFHGLIPLNEMYREVKVGARIEARVTRINNGKLRLSLRKRAKDQLGSDMEVVIAALQKGDGILYMNDDTSPEIIRRRLNLSKKAFKRAIGRLLSEGRVQVDEDSVILIKEGTTQQ